MNETNTRASARMGGRAVGLGLVAAVFFSSTYILNNLMSNSGGSWLWSASLRFFFMFPMLLVPVLVRGTLGKTLAVIRRAPLQWLLWSTVGFGIFYAPMTFASAYGPSWLVSGTYQFTIFAGALLTPLFWTLRQTPDGPVRERGKIPLHLFPAFGVILVGVFLLQLEHAQQTSLSAIVLFSLPVVVSAFAYPLGNRKMMALCGGELGTLERVFGMTMCSLPFFSILAAVGGFTVGAPSGGQLLQSGVVAIFSGVLATLIFFHATQLVHDQPHWLALTESAQSLEVPFCLLAGVLLLNNPLPGPMGVVGLVLIIGGMVANSLLGLRKRPGAPMTGGPCP